MTTHQQELTAVILTLNEASHIVDCIQSLSWADRVVVFDSYSEDDTAVLAQTAGAELHQSKFENYAQQRNAALDALHTDWVFFVDADAQHQHGALVACFDKTGGMDDAFIRQLAAFSPLRLVFRDAGFASDAVKINAEQLLKQLSPLTEVKAI